MPELSSLLSLVTLFLVCVFGFLVRARVESVQNYAHSCMEYVRNQNESSVSLAKMAAVEASLSELTDAYDALLASHKKLRSRIGMRANREFKKDHEVPDPATDPAGYKREMRLKLMRK